jgi:hypothetical protein
MSQWEHRLCPDPPTPPSSAGVPRARPRPSSPPGKPLRTSGTGGRGRSFEEVWDCIRSRGTFVAVSTRGTEYQVTAKMNRAGQKVLVARPGSGAIYVHGDCFGDDTTCQGTRAGGIYNGSPSIWEC